MSNMTRTIRLAVGTAAVLALMSQAAQARPIARPGGSAHGATSTLVRTPTPVSPQIGTPAGNVALAHRQAASKGVPVPSFARMRLQRVAVVSAGGNGFDWVAAAIGAGIGIAAMVVTAAALGTRSRRVALSS